MPDAELDAHSVAGSDDISRPCRDMTEAEARTVDRNQS